MGDKLTEGWARQAVGQDDLPVEEATLLPRTQHRSGIAAARPDDHRF
jgi:hypothetical protein